MRLAWLYARLVYAAFRYARERRLVRREIWRYRAAVARNDVDLYYCTMK